jgi:hypothetical protein
LQQCRPFLFSGAECFPGCLPIATKAFARLRA